MKALLAIALLVGCSGAQKVDTMTVHQALVLHCQLAAIQPLVGDPEHVDAAEVKAALALVKACAATADAGPAL